MRAIIFYATLLPLALGAAVTPRATCKTFDDNYDNIATSPVANTPISNYNGLLYQGWGVVNHNLSTTSVAPHTKPNVIIATVSSDLTTIGTVTLTPFGNLKRGSGTKAFNLYSFYFGCSQSNGGAEAEANIAVPCTLAITGYDVNGKQVPEATYAFAPAGSGINATPNLATLPLYYANLQNVTFGVSSGGAVGGVANTVINVDDIVHCNYT